MDRKGVTLIELLIVVAIIGILAAIAVPAYVGQKKRAARAEAYANLEALRVLEEQYFAENGSYTASIGTCAKDNPGNVALIQAALRGFKPGAGNSLNFSYCIEQNVTVDGTAKTPCFRARAFGNSGTPVDGSGSDPEVRHAVDCDNNRDF